MYVVAIAELAPATSLEAEAAALAADLGTTAYQERLNLVAGPPAVVLATADAERARSLADRLHARGHGALVVDGAQVVAAGAMVELRSFRIEEEALHAGDPADAR